MVEQASHSETTQCCLNLNTQLRFLPVAVVVKLVVTGKCNEHPKTCSQWVKDLGGSIDPHLQEKHQREKQMRLINCFEILFFWLCLFLYGGKVEDGEKCKWISTFFSFIAFLVFVIVQILCAPHVMWFMMFPRVFSFWMMHINQLSYKYMELLWNFP